MKLQKYRERLEDLLYIADLAVKAVDKNEKLSLEYNVFHNKISIERKTSETSKRVFVTFKKDSRGLVIILLNDNDYEIFARASELTHTIEYWTNDVYTGCEQKLNHSKFLKEWEKLKEQYLN